MPTTVDEVKSLSWTELNLVFALTYSAEVQAVLGKGDEALRSAVERWEPEARAAVARALAEVGLVRSRNLTPI